jgi:hypothetical protein
MMEAPNHTEPNARGEPKGKRRRRRLWLLVPLAVLILIVLAILIAVPAYLSSSSFRQMVQAKVDQATGGTLNIDNLSIGWFRGVRISNVRFRDAAGWATVHVQDVDAHPHLASLLSKSVSLGETVIEKPTIQMDLRKRPAAAPAAGKPSPSAPSQPMRLPVVGDMTIRDGVLRVTDLQGRTVSIAPLNATLNVHPAGQTSQLTADMRITDTNQPGSIRANATVTPSKGEGWSLKGTSGEFTVEVNDLDLGSLNGLLELAGVKIQTDGHLSGNIKSSIENGAVQNLTTALTGQGILVDGPALKGDQLRTSKLTVNARMAEASGALKIDQLQAETDWATLSAAGTVPTGAATFAEVVKSSPPLNVKGNFQCDLAALLSQMPHTLSLKPGMKFTAGTASGNVTAVTQNGLANVDGHAEVAGLAGTLDGKPLSLSAPLVADVKLSANEKTQDLKTLDVSSAFAKINASGNLSRIDYNGQVDLAKLQTEAGQFVNLGSHRFAGQFAAKGQASIAGETVGTTGDATIQQLVLSTGDGNNITEPSAQIRYAVSLDRPQNLLTVTNTNVKASFGAIDVPKAAIPLQANATAPMQADVALQAVDLKKLTGYGAALGYVPKSLDVSGTANSQVALSGRKSTYEIRTESTKIDNLKVTAAGKRPFEQKQVTLAFDVELPPNKEINVKRFQLTSPAINITESQLNETTQGSNTTLHAVVRGRVDWAEVGQAASVFLPEGLELSGNRDVALDVTSTYPTAKPDLLRANLNGTVSAAIDSAKYMGMNIGPTKVNIGIDKGLARISPISTTLNQGQLNFAAEANLGEKHIFLRTTKPLMLAKGVQIDTIMTETLLKHVNPLFANATAVSGLVNFDCQQLAIPLEGGMSDQAALTGVFSADSVNLDSAGLLSDILGVLQQNRGQKMVIRPTNIVLKDGVVRYDNMQVDVGNNPLNFAGAIGPKGKLNMTVTLPWTFQGRTARVGQEGQAGVRVPVPLTGTVDHPELDLSKFLQQGLFKGLENLLPR